MEASSFLSCQHNPISALLLVASSWQVLTALGKIRAQCHNIEEKLESYAEGRFMQDMANGKWMDLLGIASRISPTDGRVRCTQRGRHRLRAPTRGSWWLPLSDHRQNEYVGSKQASALLLCDGEQPCCPSRKAPGFPTSRFNV